MNTETQTQPQQQLVTQEPPQVAQAMRVANSLHAQVSALVVDSPELFEMAGSELVELRNRYKEVERQRVYLKEPYLEGGRRIDAFFKPVLDRLGEAAEVVKASMLTFQQAEEERVAKLRREQAERDRLEREELDRQEAEARERQRQADEAAAREAREAQERADAERQAAEAEAQAARAAGDDAKAAEAEERQRLAQEQADRDQAAARERHQAETLAAQQQAEAAQAQRDLADVAPPMPVVRSGAKAAGVSTRKSWKLKSCDKRVLVIAAGKAAEANAPDADQLLAALDVNETVLNGLAKQLKGALRIAGCVFGEVASLATTGRGSAR